MHRYLDEYDPAPPDRIKDALEFLPYREMSAEEYAARESHKWGSFGFDSYVYEDPELNEWIHTLGDIMFTPGAKEEARRKYLSKEEIRDIENPQNENF